MNMALMLLLLEKLKVVYYALFIWAVIVEPNIDVLTIWGFRYITDSKFWSINTILTYSHTFIRH